MAKRLNISGNNENLVLNLNDTPIVKKEEKQKKQRTSLVMNVDDYEYLKERKRILSFERNKDLTIEDVLSEIIRKDKAQKK